MIEYALVLISVIDGDTIKGRVEIWPDIETVVSVRIAGIDTPELRGKCDQEKKLAIEARNFVVSVLNGQRIIISQIKHDKYAGRVDAQVTVNGRSLAELLIENKFAKKYDGSLKPDWCPI